MSKGPTFYGGGPPEAPLIEVGIKSLEETTSTVVLADGTVIKLRPVVVQVSRLDGVWDPEGMPVYNVRSQMSMFIAEADESLKRRD